MKPQILAGMLAHPALDDGGDHLRRGLDIDLAVRPARQFIRPEPLDAEPVVGQADHPDADHRAIEAAGQPGDRRVGLASPAEERDIDTAGEMLVHHHAEMLAGDQRRRHLHAAWARVRISRPISGARMRMISFATALLFGIR